MGVLVSALEGSVPRRRRRRMVLQLHEGRLGHGQTGRVVLLLVLMLVMVVHGGLRLRGPRWAPIRRGPEWVREVQRGLAVVCHCSDRVARSTTVWGQSDPGQTIF